MKKKKKDLEYYIKIALDYIDYIGIDYMIINNGDNILIFDSDANMIGMDIDEKYYLIIDDSYMPRGGPNANSGDSFIPELYLIDKADARIMNRIIIFSRSRRLRIYEYKYNDKIDRYEAKTFDMHNKAYLLFHEAPIPLQDAIKHIANKLNISISISLFPQ